MRVSVCSERPLLVPCDLPGLNYQLDPYVGCEHCCHYCYALADAETDWSQEIQLYPDIEAQLTRELSGVPPQTIYLGYQTDPYQPVEQDYRQTRKVLQLLLNQGFSASLLTKSDLVVRDLDVLRQMDAAAVSVSVAFTDNDFRQLFEGQTIDTERRLEALRACREAGVRTGALICPVIPQISAPLSLLDQLQPIADEIWIYGLSYRDPEGIDAQNVRALLREHFSENAGEIETIIGDRDHPYWQALRERQINLHIHV